MQIQKYLAAVLAALVLAACGADVPGEPAGEAAAPMTDEAPPGTVDAGIRNVSILHLNVADMDRSLAWFQGVLGMATVRDNGGPSPTQIVAEDGAMMHTVVLEAPGDGFSMELVEVSGVELRPQEPSIQDPGAVMLAMTVSDLDGALAGARDLGLDVLSANGEPVVTEDRGRQVMVRDHDGFVSYLTQSTDPGPGTPTSAVLTFLSAADLDETVAFYNGVFGLGIDEPGELQPTSERILSLFDDRALAMMRIAQGTFPGTEVTLSFQEFSGAERTPVRHRVQDPGGPIFTMTVEDFAGVMERVEALGGTIGDGKMSATLAADASFSWIRDPNGLLIRVSAAQ